jgi:hypothetical protein
MSVRRSRLELTMELITAEQREQLLANWRASASDDNHDPKPVVKLFNPCGAATWLISEMKESDEDILFGLCDLGFGTPELGYVSRAELESIRLMGGLGIERDLYFEPTKTIGEYWLAAKAAGRIEA